MNGEVGKGVSGAQRVSRYVLVNMSHITFFFFADVAGGRVDVASSYLYGSSAACDKAIVQSIAYGMRLARETRPESFP